MLKIGHRGVKGHFAENTLQSFQKAIDLGCDGIELDVHLSSDKIAMVIHDETIDRTTTGKGFVNNFTSTELKKIGIPTLQDIFDLVNQKCFINIEIKDEIATDFVLQLIQKYNSEKKWSLELIQISSFNWNVLQECFQKNKKIQLGVITEYEVDDAITFGKKIKAFSINPHFNLLTKENVTLMHQNDFKVFPWTVNEISDIELMKSFDVDGIITDFPNRV